LRPSRGLLTSHVGQNPQHVIVSLRRVCLGSRLGLSPKGLIVSSYPSPLTKTVIFNTLLQYRVPVVIIGLVSVVSAAENEENKDHNYLY